MSTIFLKLCVQFLHYSLLKYLFSISFCLFLIFFSFYSFLSMQFPCFSILIRICLYIFLNPKLIFLSLSDFISLSLSPSHFLLVLFLFVFEFPSFSIFFSFISYLSIYHFVSVVSLSPSQFFIVQFLFVLPIFESTNRNLTLFLDFLYLEKCKIEFLCYFSDF